ncbi:hypothetical protein SAMN05421640_1523 [Ekhidna lutea]|uniref:Deoxyribose-phosphate aldolase n=1 Tax=Ekhidna lutea TaxID=447679 RepID=A0A239HUW8_EKHLU|nr:DUF6503 family protein [Ekhidna lutea]SNS85210.1 hypothetical protein SAMN05421640_1523 [Ekhidna lutea]
MKKLIAIILLIGCTDPTPTAQEVVDRAIEAAGAKRLANSRASLTFRSIDYTYSMSNGQFSYTRLQTDTVGNEVKDVLNNEGLFRYINDSLIALDDEKQVAYTSSVNSVIYFAFLPFRLNDAAVNKSFEGTIKIKDKNYYKIKVTFNQEGGGEDFDDIFYYWFDTDDYSMDYLAYSYVEEDEGRGLRFRVAYNSRKVNGVTIQDYKNLKPKIKDSVPLKEIDQAYMDGKLVELSLIELEDVVISTGQ